MKSGATETSYQYLQEHYQFPENVFVSHLPEEIKKSNHQYKILWAHHAYDQQIFENFDHNIVDYIVSPSQWNKDQFIKYLKVPENKIAVIPNGVADMFTHSDKKTKTMIFTSIPYKGLEVLARIIPMIHEYHPDTKFKIFSSMSLYGPSIDQFLDVYDYLKTLPNVEYSPAIDREELVKHYQESAFFIHPNIWEETFCVSMTEAMRCGAYPIITDIGALSEVAGERNASVVPIEGEPTSKGYAVTRDFMENFATACCSALSYYDNQPEYFKKVSKIISDYVVDKYDWKKIAKQWEKLIVRIVEGKIDDVYLDPECFDSEIYNEVYVNNEYNISELNENDIVIDIGSHRGYFAKLCLDKGSKNVICYEPNESNYKILLKNLKNYDGWKAHNVAVWKEKSESILFYNHNVYNNGVSSFYKHPLLIDRPDDIEEVNVKTVSLDSILKDYEKINLLKIDAEGSEYEILMNSTLIERVENIVGEYHDYIENKNVKDLFDFLESKNFVIHNITSTPYRTGLFFAKHQSKMSKETMTSENSSALSYNPINAEEAVFNEDYLNQASRNVFAWEESDKQMAQGRTNFQLEKFIGLNTHNISVSFEHILKERRIMATNYMYKLIEMKEKVREFNYKWQDKDKSEPLMWEMAGPGGGGKKLCWHDMDELQLTHYLRDSEMEIRDRLHQMEHLDKMLDKLVEQNGGTAPTRQQFLEENQQYWDRRLAEQALDDLMASQTGISGANLQAMRRASAPSIVDDRNTFKEGYLPMNKLLDPQGRMEFINDLQGKVMKGYEELTGTDLGYGAAIKPAEEKKKISGQGFKEE